MDDNPSRDYLYIAILLIVAVTLFVFAYLPPH